MEHGHPIGGLSFIVWHVGKCIYEIQLYCLPFGSTKQMEALSPLNTRIHTFCFLVATNVFKNPRTKELPNILNHGLSHVPYNIKNCCECSMPDSVASP
jgi:hypothetical protein